MKTRTEALVEADDRQPSTATSPDPQHRWASGPPPRWALVLAWAAFACTVPSAVWRVLMVMGAMPGTGDLRALHADEVGYVFALSAVQLVAGALVVGLVRPWGERVAGVPVPRWLPVVLGTAGGLMVTWLFTVSMTWELAHGVRPDQGATSGGALVVMVACYAPILLWGPLTLLSVLAYRRRRRR